MHTQQVAYEKHRSQLQAQLDETAKALSESQSLLEPYRSELTLLRSQLKEHHKLQVRVGCDNVVKLRGTGIGQRATK